MSDLITWADFEKVEICAGTVTEVTDFPNAKKPAYQLTIDFGEHGIKRSSAQITHHYNKDELMGKQVVAVINFPVKQIANFFSECLVLGVYDESKQVVLLTPIRKLKTEEKLVDTRTHTVYYNSPIGVILLEAEDDQLTVVSFRDDVSIDKTGTTTSPALQKAIQQLDEYFAGARKLFDLPLQPQGTAFQQKVWDQLMNIPYAETVTYLHMAKRLGNVKSIRAAASANGKNPIGIIIPCHRVVGADGKLTGYAGGLHRKQWLLEHEAKMAGKSSSLF